MRAPRLFFAILLACLLVFAQQAGAVHALSHFTEKQTSQPEKHPSGTKACEKCVVFAELGSAAPATIAVLHILQLTQHLTLAILKGTALAELTPYQSRAPPFTP